MAGWWGRSPHTQDSRSAAGRSFPTRGGSMRNRLLVLSAGVSLAAAAIAGTAGGATASASRATTARPPAVPSSPSAYFDSRASAAPLRATAAQTAAVHSLLQSVGSGARITYDPIFGTPH